MALSLLSFSLADVRDGLGPFLGVYLQGKNWMPDEIGYVMTVSGLAGMLLTTPLGALADGTRKKRSMLAVVTGMIVLSVMMIFRCHFSLSLPERRSFRESWLRLWRRY